MNHHCKKRYIDLTSSSFKSLKTSLKENSQCDKHLDIIEPETDQMKASFFQDDQYGIWTLKENGPEIEVFLLSNITDGIKMKGRFQKEKISNT